MGHLGLRARLRRLPAARRPPRRPARAAARLHGRARHLHDRVAPLRALVERGIADRRPRAAGPRRGHDLARSALDPDDDVPRGPRAQHRPRRLGRGRRRRCRCRRPARRRPRRPPLVAVDLLRQRPRRDHLADRWRRSCSPRAATSASRASTSSAPCSSPPGSASSCSGSRRATTGAGRRVGRSASSRRRRVLLVGFIAPGVADEASADAVLDLPAADADGREHRDVHHGHGAVLDVPDADALHAAGSPLLAAEDGRRLSRRRRDGDHLGERRGRGW